MRQSRRAWGEPRSGALAAALAGLTLVAAACGPDDQVGSPVDLEVAKGALDSAGGGFQYWSLCQANSVPFPQPWGASTIGTGLDKWTSRGQVQDSFIGALPVDIYTMNSSNPPGVCAIAARAGGVFDVLCQGRNGKACFWEAEMNFWPGVMVEAIPPAIPQSTTIPIVGFIPAAPDQGNQCTQCHTGDNAFISHRNPGHPTNLLGVVADWMPTTRFNPIVPSTWTQNPGPSSTGYPSSCLTGGCHATSLAGGGQFPLLRNHDYDAFGSAWCYNILQRVVSVPASQGGMPPNVADCVPGDPIVSKRCPIENDPAVQAMVAACGHPLAPTSVPSQSQVFGLGPPYGVGTTWRSSKMHVSASAQGIHQHYFFNATTTMPNPGCCTPHQNPHGTLASDDTINVWVFIPTGDAPREIMIQIHDGTTWRRAYWGDDMITTWGARTRIGNLPPTGSWQPLAFRPVHIGLFGPLTLNGMAYTLYNGSAYWADTLFRQAANPYLSEYVSQMWVKDSVPAGATTAADGGDTWTFVTP